MKQRLVVLAIAVVIALCSPTIAAEYKIGNLVVDYPWARASIGQAKAGAAYLTIVNHGSVSDRLIGVETPVAANATLHTHLLVDGVMKMRPLKAIEVAPGEPAVLKPGGLHVMLTGLKAPLLEGQDFPLILVFEGAGRVDVTVSVGTAAAMEPQKGHGHGS